MGFADLILFFKRLDELVLRLSVLNVIFDKIEEIIAQSVIIYSINIFNQRETEVLNVREVDRLRVLLDGLRNDHIIL